MQAAGIHIDGSTLRCATLKKTGKGLRIIACKTQTHGQNVKPLYTPFPLISGLSSRDLMIRSLPFSARPNRNLRKALILQVETQLHLKPEELITLSLLETTKKRTTTYTTTQSALQDHLEVLKALQLDPERVGAIPAALQAFIQWKAPDIHSYFLIDIGMSLSNCIWVENGTVRQAHAIESENRKNTEEAKNFRRELAQLLHSFQCQRPLIFTGDPETTKALRGFLMEMLRDYVTDEIKIKLSLDEQRYAICLGLAIDYLLNRKQPLQFRKGSSLSIRDWKRLGAFSMSLIVSSLLVCTSVYEIGSWWMAKREREIVNNLETWVAAKDPSLRLELFSVGNKTKDLVDQWLSMIEKNTKDYPFFMQAPRVASVLNWLLRHPLIESFQSAGDPLSFEQIHYQLSSFPRLGALREPTLVKVELDFTITNPMHARQFHQTLLQGDGFIDITREITWEVLPDRYRTSFYLKNESHGFL